MKRVLFLFSLLVGSTLMAQEGSVGIGTQTPNEKAVLHLVAPNNDQGFLVPKLTTTQRNNFSIQLTSAENGMMVFDSDLNQFFFWMTDHWEAVGSSLQAGSGIEIVNGVITNTGDTDASDDFSGDWVDLSNVPAGFADGTDNVDDADANPINELQDLNLSGDILTITGLTTPTQIDLSAYTGTNTDEQDLLFSAGQISLSGDPDNTIIDLSNYDSDASNDFSGDWADLQNVPTAFLDGSDDDADNDPTNEIELPSTAGLGEVLKFNDALQWAPATDQVDDADADPNNELQDLNLTSNILTITGVASPTQINLAAYLGNNTDEQDLQFLDGQISLTGDPDGTVIDLSLFDTDFTDDFSGSFLDLDDVPFYLDTDATDDFSGYFADLLEVPANLDLDATDDFSGQWADLMGIPTDFQDGLDNVDDADSDAGNELQDLVYDGETYELSITSSSLEPISLAGLLDNTDVLADLLVSEGQIPKFSGGTWQAGIDEFEDEDADPSNEIQDLVYDSEISQLTLTNSAGSPVDLSYLLDNTDVLSSLDPLEGQIPKFSEGVWSVMDDNVDDADADQTNEIQDLTFDPLLNILTITNNPDATPINLSGLAGGISTIVGTPGDVLKYDALLGWQAGTDEVNDDDPDPLNELQSLQFEGSLMWLDRDPEGNDIDLSIYNTDVLADLLPSEGQIAKYIEGAWVVDNDNVDDADNDPNNERQDLFYDSRGYTLNITNNLDASIIDLSGLRDNTDNQDLELIDGSLELTNDATPVDLSAYFDNTDLLAGLSGSNGQVVKHNGVTWIAGTDEVNDSDSDPTNENQTVTAGTGISVVKSGENFTVTNTARDQVVSITGSGSASVTGSYPNFNIDVPSSGGNGQFAFKAGNSKGLIFPGEGVPVEIIFEAISYDVGETYPLSTFTTPIDGIYSFTGTITTQITDGGDVYLYLLKNGKDVMHAVDRIVAAQDVISFMADMQLVKGDIISVHISSMRGGTVVGNPAQTNFSGRLVLSN